MDASLRVEIMYHDPAVIGPDTRADHRTPAIGQAMAYHRPNTSASQRPPAKADAPHGSHCKRPEDCRYVSARAHWLEMARPGKPYDARKIAAAKLAYQRAIDKTLAPNGASN